MKIVGCDYNTKGEFWASMRDGNLSAIYEYRFSKERDYADRLASIPELIFHYPTGRMTPAKMNAALEGSAEWYAIEGYVSFHDREGKMAGMYWKIRERMNRLAKPLILPPKRWKVVIGLSGNADKPAIKTHILNLYPELPPNLPQDAYDAVGIVRAAALTINTEPWFLEDSTTNARIP